MVGLFIVTVLSGRAAAAGWCVDPAFGDGGFALLDVRGDDNVFWTAQGLSVLPDGRLVVGGSFDGGFFAARLDAKGRLDPSFGDGGVVEVPFVDMRDVQLNAVATFPNGGVVLGGELRGTSNQLRIALARLLPTGALDPAFGGGVLLPAFWPEPELVNGLVALPDGRTLIGGHGRTRGTDVNVFVAALDADGGLDPAFGNFGVTHLDVNANDEFGGAIVLDGQQRVLVPMSITTPSGQDFGLARLVSSGLFDGTFASGALVGRRQLDLGSDDQCTVVMAQADGRILAGGEQAAPDGGGRGALVRLTNDGLFDPTFTDGALALELPEFRAIRGLLELTDGTLVVGGALVAGTSTDLGVLFLDAAGRRLDAGFANPVRIDVAGFVDGVRTLKPDGTGGVLAFGEAGRGGQNDVALFHLIDCALADAGVVAPDAGVFDAGAPDAGLVDAGSDAGVDGGGEVSDAGVGSARSFSVACGCSSSTAEALAVLVGVLLAQGLRRRARAAFAESSSE